jgi:hypothetical protein
MIAARPRRLLLMRLGPAPTAEAKRSAGGAAAEKAALQYVIWASIFALYGFVAGRVLHPKT